MIKEGRTPVPVPSRPALYELSLYHLDTPQDGSPYSVNTDPIQQTPPDYHYQLTPPNKLMYLASPINPMELPPDARNPHGSNYIVQTAEQAYELMKAEAEGRFQHGQMHMPPRPGPGAPIGSIYPSGGEGVGYPVYTDPRTQPHPHAHVRQQEQSSPSWQAQQSPASIPRGWQEPSPRTQGRLVLSLSGRPRFQSLISVHSGVTRSRCVGSTSAAAAAGGAATTTTTTAAAATTDNDVAY